MFVLDWLLFDKRHTFSVIDPLTWTAIPLVYLTYALIRGVIVGPNGNPQYPYFFINVTEIGYDGVAVWGLILLVAFLGVGYLIWFIDKLVKVDGKIKVVLNNKED